MKNVFGIQDRPFSNIKLRSRDRSNIESGRAWDTRDRIFVVILPAGNMTDDFRRLCREAREARGIES